MLLHQLIEDYWQEFVATHEQATVDSQQYVVESFQNHFDPEFDAEDIRPYHVKAWVDSTKAKKDSTKNARITFAIGVLEWGRRMGYVTINNLKGMPRPTPSQRELFIPQEQWDQVIEFTPIPWRDYVVFMLTTGARPREVPVIEARHFDADKRCLVFSKAESKGRRHNRVIYLPQRAYEIVARLAEQYDTGPLFRNSRGGAVTKFAVNKVMQKIGENIGVQGLCATVLRHSFAHHRLTTGQDATAVAKLMGHKDTTMVLTRYGHLENSNWLREQADYVASN